ncbi:hypothetical protein [Flavobacterium sp.]|uniref:hypothetical protein n=1 Tax=Flavobacterium sp. TaxID=239 RepID=UPI0035297AA5
MKKITLLLSAFVLVIGTTIAKASSEKVFDDGDRRILTPIDYRYADPIVFMERGIEFYVFPNGDFDFNTVTTTASQPRNATYGAPRSNTNRYHNPAPMGVRVEHDYMGRVRRVGNVFINYDAYGRVKRVGSVYMSYNSFALKQVGNLRIIYDNRGRIINIIGFVNNSSTVYNYNQNGGVYYGPSNGNYGSYNYNDTSNNDDDFYYYRTDGTKAKINADEVIEIQKEEKETATPRSKK